MLSKVDQLRTALSFIEEAESALHGVGDIDWLEEAVTKLALQLEYEIKARECNE